MPVITPTAVEFELGQRVAYSEHIRRRDTGPGEFDFDKPNRIWSTNGGPFSGTGWEEHRWPGGEGVIVGKRTLSNGRASWQEEGYTQYTIKETFIAYLIAYDLRRKPVHVLPEHITALEVDA